MDSEQRHRHHLHQLEKCLCGYQETAENCLWCSRPRPSETKHRCDLLEWKLQSSFHQNRSRDRWDSESNLALYFPEEEFRSKVRQIYHWLFGWKSPDQTPLLHFLPNSRNLQPAQTHPERGQNLHNFPDDFHEPASLPRFQSSRSSMEPSVLLFYGLPFRREGDLGRRSGQIMRNSEHDWSFESIEQRRGQRHGCGEADRSFPYPALWVEVASE